MRILVKLAAIVFLITLAQTVFGQTFHFPIEATWDFHLPIEATWEFEIMPRKLNSEGEAVSFLVQNSTNHYEIRRFVRAYHLNLIEDGTRTRLNRVDAADKWYGGKGKVNLLVLPYGIQAEFSDAPPILYDGVTRWHSGGVEYNGDPTRMRVTYVAVSGPSPTPTATPTEARDPTPTPSATQRPVVVYIKEVSSADGTIEVLRAWLLDPPFTIRRAD